MRSPLVLSGFCCVLLARGVVGAGVVVRFDPANPEIGPFPTDALTVADPSQKTGRRVNLPLPDCAAQPSSCAELSAINQLDGFSVRPRLRLRFSSPINPDTLRDGVVFVALDNLTQEESGVQQAGGVIPINEVIYDPATNTAYAKADNVLDQHRRFALVATDAVRDLVGDPVAADPAFAACVQPAAPDDYCAALSAALATVAPSLAPRQVVAAAVFTTLSATAWMEKARAQLANTSVSEGPAGPRAVFRMADIASLVWNQQVGVNPSRFNALEFPLDPSLFTGVGSVAFGSFFSPRWLDDQQSIALAPTGADVAPPPAFQIHFSAYLPASSKPAAGYPVVIFGHGLGDSRFGGPTAVASQMAQEGFATVAITAAGHGYGPDSTLTILTRDGASATLPGGGRGVDVNGDGNIDATEGCILFSNGAALRDCLRQTALDLAQLVRAIQAGIDLDGDGAIDLDASRIYYAGQSLGSLYGAVFNALEPGVRAAAFNVGGGSVIDLARWSPAFRPLVAMSLGLRTPTLLNMGGDFNENYVLRDQPARINDVAGAIDIQNVLELYDWLGMPGDPVAYAPHLNASPLPGLPAKRVLWQIARGDRTVPNPSSTILIRAANMRDSTWLYRHDVARAALPELPVNPHPYLVLFVELDGNTIQLPSRAGLLLSDLAQQQIARFLALDGGQIPDPNGILLRALFGQNLFEVPAVLPVDLGF